MFAWHEVQEDKKSLPEVDPTPLLSALDYQIVIEAGAGTTSGNSDEAYEKAGARILSSRKEIYGVAEISFRITAPEIAEVEDWSKLKYLIALLEPYRNQALFEKLAQMGVQAFALELVPRISRAQNMDVLSSMASAAGLTR